MAADFCFESMVERAGSNHRAWAIDKDSDGIERQLSYSELVGSARRLATRLKALGLKAREIIGIKSSNRLEFLVWELAAIMCDAVLQVFPEDFPGEDVKQMEQYGLRLFVSESATAEGAVDGIFDIASTLPLGDIALASGVASLAAHSDLHSKTFSSGTAGALKGLMISRRGTESIVNQFIKAFGIADNDSTILFLPLSHYPQRLTLYASLWAGTSLCLADVDEVTVAATEKYVDAPHITLLQVNPGHDIDDLKQAVARWAAARTPFELVAQSASATLFGLPLVTVAVEPSGPLIDSLATLRQ